MAPHLTAARRATCREARPACRRGMSRSGGGLLVRIRILDAMPRTHRPVLVEGIVRARTATAPVNLALPAASSYSSGTGIESTSSSKETSRLEKEPPRRPEARTRRLGRRRPDSIDLGANRFTRRLGIGELEGRDERRLRGQVAPSGFRYSRFPGPRCLPPCAHTLRRGGTRSSARRPSQRVAPGASLHPLPDMLDDAGVIAREFTRRRRTRRA